MARSTVSGSPWSEAILAGISLLCEADPAREVCGFVVRREGALEVVPVPNVADPLHAADPLAFPRTSRDAYRMDPKVQLRLHRELAARGGAIVGVWHSHVEAGARFSAQDRADALVDGSPVLPGAEYLVVSVRGGRTAERRRYTFADGAFGEAPV
jgi:proteasome lid subunit RPN8/RPN11